VGRSFLVFYLVHSIGEYILIVIHFVNIVMEQSLISVWVVMRICFIVHITQLVWMIVLLKLSLNIIIEIGWFVNWNVHQDI